MNSPKKTSSAFRLLPPLLASLLLATTFAARASAQSARRLPSGRAVTVRGTLRPGTNQARVEYAFRATAGQKISVKLTSNRVRYGEGDTAGAVFFILDRDDRHPPDFGDYPYGGPIEWAGALPASGHYRIRVLVEDGPDDPSPATLRRLNLAVHYTLKVTFPRR